MESYTKPKKKTLLLLLLIPLFILGGSLPLEQSAVPTDNLSPSFSRVVNQNVTQTLPFSTFFHKLGIRIRLSTGEQLQKGVFISPKGLMKDMPEPNYEIMLENNQRLLQFAELSNGQAEDKPIFFSILPSASAVFQQNLPRFSVTVNQRNLIENAYNPLSGIISTVDCYSTLLNNRERYLYYRTEDGLTPMGGFFVYQSLATRIFGAQESKNENNFSVSYGPEFRGELYEKVPFDPIASDQQMYYHYVGRKLEYEVRHLYEGEENIFHTLYPMAKEGVATREDTYFGGGKGVTTIITKGATPLHLLVFGDDSMRSFVPFFTPHYGQITLVHQDAQEEWQDISLSEYDHILFISTFENYTTKELYEPAVSLAETQWGETIQ